MKESRIALGGRPDPSRSTGLIREVALEPVAEGSGFEAKVTTAPGLWISHRVGPGRIWVVACREVVLSARGCPEAEWIQGEAARRREVERQRVAREQEEERRQAEEARRAQEAQEAAEEQKRQEERAAEAAEQAARREAANEPRTPSGDQAFGILQENSILRAGPGTAYDALHTLPRGTRVQVTGRESRWLAVQAGSAVGWIAERLVGSGARSASAAATPGTSSSVPSIGTGITNSRVSLRAEPSVQSERLLVLSEQREVNVLSVSGRWIEVEVSGVRGWVYGQYLDRQ